MTTAPGAAAPAAAPAPGSMKPSAQPLKTVSAPEVKAPDPQDPRKAKHKVKLEGVESEVDYDELVRGYQKAQVSDRRYQEAARLHSEAQKVNQALESGDVNFLVQKMGPEKARKVMEDYLITQMQYDQLPPAEKALREEKKKRETLEAQVKDQEQKQQQARYDDLAQKAFYDLDQEMAAALKAIGKKPNPRIALRMLEQIEARLKAKEERIPAEKAWEFARHGLIEDMNLIAPDMTVEELHSMLGPENVKRLMNHKVEQVLGAKQERRPKQAPTAKEASKPKSIDDHYKELEKRLLKRG